MIFSPVQVTPFPEYPIWQVQSKEPLVLVQFAFVWQLWERFLYLSDMVAIAHSFTSERQQQIIKNLN